MPKERVERDEEDLVRLYLTDIGQYPLLTKDDEVRLAKAIEGGTAATEELERGGKELSAARKREHAQETCAAVAAVRDHGNCSSANLKPGRANVVDFKPALT